MNTSNNIVPAGSLSHLISSSKLNMGMQIEVPLHKTSHLGTVILVSPNNDLRDSQVNKFKCKKLILPINYQEPMNYQEVWPKNNLGFDKKQKVFEILSPIIEEKFPETEF